MRKKHFGIGLACANLWNEINYGKRQVFFGGELLPGKRDEINKAALDNEEVWRSFSKLLDLRRLGKLHAFTRGYRHQAIGRIGLLGRRR